VEPALLVRGASPDLDLVGLGELLEVLHATHERVVAEPPSVVDKL
jgi:hypothetical protein